MACLLLRLNPRGDIRAAEYLRMSTDGQQYSIANQQAAIRQYAMEHGFRIVRTYSDPRKSESTANFSLPAS